MKRTISPISLPLIIFLILAGITLAGCPRPTVTTTTTTSKATTTSVAPTTTTAKPITITLYFIKDFDQTMFLVPEQRTVPKTTAPARAALEELIKGPKTTGLTSVIPNNTKVRSVTIKNGLATVDFSKEILNANVGAMGEVLGIAQIVNTLTEFSSITKVRFLVEGKDKGKIDGREVQDWWGHIGLYQQPFSRNNSVIQGGKVTSDTIRVDLPRAFTFIPNPITVKGTARVFEAQFNVRILDKNNTVLADEPIMASGFNWGSFNKTISYKKPTESGRGTVLFYFLSPKDGSEVTMAAVTVFFQEK